MKRIIIVLILAALCRPAGLYAQASRPNAAVYVHGKPPNYAILQAAFNNALVNSGKYNVIAVDEIDAVMREHRRQMSGSVRESEIAKLGQDAGAAFMLVAERVDDVAGFYRLSAKMVSVERKIAVMSNMSERISDTGDVAEAINELVAVMLKIRPPVPKNVINQKDGKNYRTVTINGKTWMAENLNNKVGDSWCYADKDSNCVKYGRLYDWRTASSACPYGWRLPTRAEWAALAESAGGGERAAKGLKAGGAGWNGEDDYGWSAMPGGFRYPDGTYSSVGDMGAWWSSGESDDANAYGRYINASRGGIYEGSVKKRTGYSVRCVSE